MKNILPDWARLHPDLNKRQRITAVALIVFGILASILCLIVIFALADLGRPSLLPWIAWFLFGVGPIVAAMEEYGAEENEAVGEAGASTEMFPELSTPPHLRLIHSPGFTDNHEAREETHDRHVRRVI